MRTRTLIGRDEELRVVRDAIAAHRVVTLRGPGGTGKTTLALAVVAGRPRTAVALLAGAGGPEGALVAIAHAVGDAVGVAGLVPAALPEALADEALLLVLDNVEGLGGLGEALDAVLSAAPGVRVLATGQVPLGMPGEHVIALRPLALPGSDDPGEVACSPAGALYLHHAPWVALDRASARDLRALLEVLDGVPLAVELAASRSRVLGLAELTDRLRRDSAVLRRRGHAGRHASLGAAIDWSLELAGPEAATLFARLGVFSGTWTAARADTICRPAPEAHPILVEYGLVREGPDGRFGWPEAVASHARALLASSGDEVELRRRHAADLAGRALAAFEASLGETAGIAWLAGEDGDVLAALRWSVEHDHELHQSLTAAAGWWLARRGHTAEALGHLEIALDRPAAGPDDAALLHAAGAYLVWSIGRHRRAQQHARTAEVLATQGLPRRVALTALAAMASYDGDVPTTERAVRELGTGGEPLSLTFTAQARLFDGDLDEAQAILDRAVRLGLRDENVDALSADIARERLDPLRAVRLRLRALDAVLAHGDTGASLLLRLYCLALDIAPLWPADALALEAAATRLGRLVGAGPPPDQPGWQTWRDRHLRPARRALGPVAAARATERGRAMDLAATLTLARSLPDRLRAAGSLAAE